MPHPFIPVPNTVRCDAVFRLFGQKVENVFDVEVPAGVVPGTVADVAGLIGAWVIGTYLPLMSSDVHFLFVEAKDLTTHDGATATYVPTGAPVGGSAGASMPGATSLAISLRTSLGGRSFRGRKYTFGLNRSQVVDNAVLPGYAADFVAAFNSLISVLVAADKLLVVVSRVADHIDRIVGVTTPVTTAVAADLNVDSQRRRLNGRGS
jgi:hypothetical protein